jgi:outer membrane protein insertion porin family
MTRRILSSLLLGLCLPAAARAQALDLAQPEPADLPWTPGGEIAGTVGEIRVVGLRRVEEAAILAAIELRTGEPLAGWKLQRDIKAVFKTGFVDDVQIDVRPAGGSDPNELRVTFRVVEKPAVRDVKLAGNKKLDEDTLREVIDISSFAVLNASDVNRNVQYIREKYVEKGYYLVVVDPVITPIGDDMVELTFDITEGRKVVVQTIDITGNDNVTDRKIRRFMQTKQGGLAPWLTNSGTFDETLLDADMQVVRSVFLEEGYADIAVDPPKVYLSPDRRTITVTIHVIEGTRYKLGRLKVEGDFVPEEGLTAGAAKQVLDGETARTVRERWEQAQADADAAGLTAPPADWDQNIKRRPLDFREQNPAMETGDWFKLTTMQTAMQSLQDLYGDQGYAFANVVPLTATDPETGLIDITFDVQRGEKVRIGRIEITGNDPTFDKVVRREIPINEGEIYSGSALAEARERINRLGYFEEVKITTPRGPEPDVLDMRVEVKEQPTGSFSVGAGFSNLENFVFTANISKNNFLGLGYVMSAAANISRKRQQGNLRLYDPYFLDSRWTLRVDGFSIARQFIEDEYQRGGSMGLGRYLDARDDIRMEMAYTFEDTGITSIDAYKEHLLGGQLYRNGITSTGSLSLNVDKRNNRVQATKGVYGSLSADLSGGFRKNETEVQQIFGGEFNFYELKANMRAFYPVIPGNDRLVFKYNTTLGKIGGTDGTVVPYIHRYRAGGIQSVRGYDWYTLGPSIRAQGYKASSRSTFVGSDDPTSADDKLVVGGTETWINNLELEQSIVKQAGISAVVFFDAGNAFGDPWGVGHINPADLRMSYGWGVRWFSPMGPLRFEWGIPIAPYEDERKVVFDFSIGSLF